MKKIVITGASGFIGKTLLKKILKEKVFVYAVVREKKKLADFFDCDNLCIVEADLSQYKKLSYCIHDSNIDICYHLAWEGTFGESFKDYALQMNNAIYAADTLMVMKNIGCKKFVLAGSIIEIETQQYLRLQNGQPRIACIYGTSKIAAEMLCKTLAYNYGINFNCALLANTYGIGDTSRTLIKTLITFLLEKKKPSLIAGEGLYDCLYVEDVADLLLAVGEKGINQKRYYIGNRKLRTFKKIVEEIRDIINPEIYLEFGGIKENLYVDFSLVDLDELYRDTGVEAKIDFSESIRKTAEWIKNTNL